MNAYENPENKVYQAVLPLLDEAIRQANKQVDLVIAAATKALEDANWDLKIAAPYPKARNTDPIVFKQQLAYYQFLSSITSSVKSSRNMNEPHIVYMNQENCDRYRQQRIEDAKFSFLAYVAKLIRKIGDEVTEASLYGDYLWNYSILTVTTASGTTKWKTQVIINVSKYGKMFNQFPTRQVKEKA